MNEEEVLHFLSVKHTIDQVKLDLNNLVDRGKVQHFDGYYGLSEVSKNLSNRKKLNLAASKVMDKAIHNGALIKKFPFVKGVFISGGLSKGVFDEEGDGDFDYFIISQKNRIWISKFSLKLYKLFFMNNSKKYFCFNYFIAEDQLLIAEKNIFTATELITLIPIQSQDIHEQLMGTNNWVQGFYPNAILRENQKASEDIKSFTMTKFIQLLCVGFIGNFVDTLLMYVNKSWNFLKYYSKNKDLQYNLRFRSTKSEAKIHPPNHQGKVLRQLENHTID